LLPQLSASSSSRAHGVDLRVHFALSVHDSFLAFVSNFREFVKAVLPIADRFVRRWTKGLHDKCLVLRLIVLIVRRTGGLIAALEATPDLGNVRFKDSFEGRC
jgi:hypothetical protein